MKARMLLKRGVIGKVWSDEMLSFPKRRSSDIILKQIEEIDLQIIMDYWTLQ
ncbi:MAG: hypothetical protein HYZ08_00925 [Candidatus Kerfeldbacteria bacterium]|nr:hypothetical protein [Candidatus Kerfeldbacteria bacterium]